LPQLTSNKREASVICGRLLQAGKLGEMFSPKLIKQTIR
jgi:hypothetical protein